MRISSIVRSRDAERPNPDRVENTTGIAVRAVSKAFRLRESTVQALQDLTLTSPYQKVLTLLGPSGCGKTTLLRCIAGLEVPDSGEIQIGGTVVFSSTRRLFLPPNKRGISMVFQSYAIWPHMTVFGNVAYPLEVQKTPRKEVRERVRETLARVRLDGFETRPAAKLSGGQQQRVALARALVAQPKVLLFDEPLSNLDAKLREEARKELRTFLSESAISAIYVTHDRLEALTISDTIAVMRAGQLIEIGAPKDLYHDATQKFVVSFIGDANFVDGEISRRAGELAFARSPLGGVACKAASELPIGTKGSICMRPEVFDLITDDLRTDQNVFHGKVEEVLFTGEASEVDVEIGEVRLTVRLSPFADIKKGDRIALFASPDRCQFIPEQ